MKSGFLKITKKFIFGLFIFFLLLLLTAAGSSTAIVDGTEHTYLVRDLLSLNLIAFALVLFLLFFLKRKERARAFVKKVNSDAQYSAKCRRILLLAIAGLSVLFLVTVQSIPQADPRWISNIADHWIDRDYSDFLPGGYLDRYPHQLGITILLYFYGHIFGTNNYLVFQLLNVAGLCLFYYDLAKIEDFFGHDAIIGLLTVFFGFLFAPAIMYTAFVYGTILGLAAAVECIKRTLLFSKTHRIVDATAAVLAIFLAVTLKSNYQIFFIGLGICIVLELVRKFDMKLVVLFLCMLAAVLLNGTAVKGAAKLITGQETGEGSSMWSFVATGLMENELDLYRGWHNGYDVTSYRDNDFDTARQKEENLSYIKERLREFAEAPGEALHFFVSKNISQWNNPEFQGLEINRIMLRNVRLPSFMNRLFSEPGQFFFTQLFNLLQFLYLAGSVLFLVFAGKKDDRTLIYAVIFIGGFLFHTVWEAKAQYTLPYWMLLLPVSAQGYYGLAKGEILPLSDGRRPVKRDLYLLAGILILLLLPVTVFRRGADKLLDLTADTAAYRTYLTNHTPIKLKSGRYLVCAEEDPDMVLSDGTAEEKRVRLTKKGEDDQRLWILFPRFEQTFRLQFPDTGNYLINKERDGELLPTSGSYAYGDSRQDFYLIPEKGTGAYYIVDQNGLALTYDVETGTIFLKGITRESNQRFLLEPEE